LNQGYPGLITLLIFVDAIGEKARQNFRRVKCQCTRGCGLRCARNSTVGFWSHDAWCLIGPADAGLFLPSVTVVVAGFVIGVTAVFVQAATMGQGDPSQ